MKQSAAHANRPCWDPAAPVLDDAPSARWSSGFPSATDLRDEPEVVRLSRRPKRDEYRDRYTSINSSREGP